MKYIVLLFGLCACRGDKDTTTDTGDDTTSEEQGANMLLIGNSFFKPYAQNLDIVAADAGFEEHNSTIITRGGDKGHPISFWEDSTTDEHKDIKSTLDEGGLDFFGMTSGHDFENPVDRIEGHRAWIDYALQNNPDITIFLAIPTVDFPEDWDQRAADLGYNTIQEMYTDFIADIVHTEMVDQLREEFPSTNIFTVPTGWSAINLTKMQEEGTLLDDITMSGPQATSIFTDEKGHQGQIVVEAGTLVWLNSIYNVDLSTNTYDTGFNTDLHSIAQQIMDEHDLEYKQ